MKKEDAEEFTQSFGQIVAGSWRQVALAKRLGVPKALGLTLEDWVQEKLGGYIRLAILERREAVVELSAEGMSQREIGEMLGVDERTIRRDVDAAANAAPPEIEPNENSSLTITSAANAAPLDAVAALAADEEIQTGIEREKKRQET
ncbi:MAG: helix-turn-helix domain-containing protein [Gammaproteobacteria bacterium]